MGNWKNILVTGSSSGIGAEIVRVLSKQKYVESIGIHYNKNKKGALQLKNEISDRVSTEIFQCNFQIPQIDIIERFVSRFGSIDVLVNCAGVVSSVSFEKITEEEYDRVMNINAKTPFLITSKAFNVMKRQKGGKIINISSVTTKFGMGRNKSIHYAASKAVLDILTVGLARIGAKYNILVNSISPGPIMTDIQKEREDLEERQRLIPLGRFGTPLDVANMVEYLVSDKGNFITGEIITISGGE